MISIAMTTYNGEKYIEKQLESILNQTVKPDEVIIVDDCSKDNTVSLVNNFIKNNNLNNWNIIELSKNYGFINSFNEAIKRVSGDIIFLCDQDDIWLQNKIQLMTEIIIKNPKILCLTSGFIKIDSNDNVIATKRNPFSANNNLIRKRITENDCINIDILQVITYNVSPGCTYAFKKEIKEDFINSINDKNFLPHDWKINIIAALYKGLYFLNTPTIKYRIHENNTLGLNRNLNIEDRIKSCKKSNDERNYMEYIIRNINSRESVMNKELIYKYINKINKSLIERQIALKNKNIFRLIYILFKYNLFKNRMYESIIVDIATILNSYTK